MSVFRAILSVHLIDTHCHLDEEAFRYDVAEVIARAEDAGVQAMLTIGITADSSRRAVELAGKFANVYAVVGIQPNYVSAAKPGDWDEIVELASAPKVVGIGETGLDRYWDYSPIEMQAEYFDRHLELSRTRNLPFVVHCRNAEDDVVAQLRRAAAHGPLSGVMHSFCGSAATAQACCGLGMHISFAGMLTFKRNDELRQTAATIPAERLLVETDAPYLSPAPAPRQTKRTRQRGADVCMSGDVSAEDEGRNGDHDDGQRTPVVPPHVTMIIVVGQRRLP